MTSPAVKANLITFQEKLNCLISSLWIFFLFSKHVAVVFDCACTQFGSILSILRLSSTNFVHPSLCPRASPSHTLTFIPVYKQYRYFTAFNIVLACMSVFESPPHHSIRMDQDQTYRLSRS